MIPLQLPGPGLFSSKLHYSISAKAFVFNRHLKSAEPCITNTFLHFSKQQIKQMTHTADIMSLLQKMPASRRLTDWYILMQIASKIYDFDPLSQHGIENEQ